MNDTPAPFPTDPNATQAPFSVATRRKGLYSRRPYDVLGIAWIHGSFHAAIFRRQTLKRAWECPAAVRTPDDFESALDEAVVSLRFGGSEVFLILEHDQFSHQAEQAPAFSDAAARNYLRGRVERFEQEHGPALWISQRTSSARKEASFLIHLLPSEFYGKINGMLLARRLDLTRILPVVVPLQLALESLNADKEQPVLIAADTGDSTTVMVGRANGELLFARTMLARWDTDPARIGVEVNRSVLYAKQQFGTIVEKIWLLGTAGEPAKAEVQTRCGTGKDVSVQNSTPIHWLQSVAKLTPRHPINLVAGYLGRKRRQQLSRRIAIAACWLTLSLLGLDAWTRVQNQGEERAQLATLQRNRVALENEKAQLTLRNAEAQRLRDLIKELSEDRLPAVPTRVLAYFSGSLPPEAQFTEFSTQWEATSGKWTFSVEGQIEGDEDSNRESIATFQKQLTSGPLHAQVNDASRGFVAVSAGGTEGGLIQRFNWEGTLFEN